MGVMSAALMLAISPNGLPVASSSRTPELFGPDVRYVFGALLRYAGRLDNGSPELERCGIAINKPIGRRLFFGCSRAGAPVDLATTRIEHLGAWFESLTADPATFVLDANEAYARCVAHYDCDEPAWMPVPQQVRDGFLSWSATQQAAFLHRYVAWYDRPGYREPDAIADALTWLEQHRTALGTWHLQLREAPLDVRERSVIVAEVREAVANARDAAVAADDQRVVMDLDEGLGLDPAPRGPPSQLSQVLRILGEGKDVAHLPRLLKMASVVQPSLEDPPETLARAVASLRAVCAEAERVAF